METMKNIFEKLSILNAHVELVFSFEFLILT